MDKYALNKLTQAVMLTATLTTEAEQKAKNSTEPQTLTQCTAALIKHALETAIPTVEAQTQTVSFTDAEIKALRQLNLSQRMQAIYDLPPEKAEGLTPKTIKRLQL